MISQNLHAHLHTLTRILKEKSDEQKQLAMEESLDTSINKTVEMQSSEGMPCFLDINQTGKMNHAKDERTADLGITQKLSLEGTSENHPVPSSTQSRLS